MMAMACSDRGASGRGREIQRNMRSVAHAIAQQELEGLRVSPSTIADLHRAARGEIDTDEAIRNIYRRLRAAPTPLP